MTRRGGMGGFSVMRSIVGEEGGSEGVSWAWIGVLSEGCGFETSCGCGLGCGCWGNCCGELVSMTNGVWSDNGCDVGCEVGCEDNCEAGGESVVGSSSGAVFLRFNLCVGMINSWDCDEVVD